MTKSIVFVLGGPGSGKGTQCERIVAEYGYKHLSAGDLLRAEVESGSETGKMCAELMKEGKLVPMEVTIGLLEKSMNDSGAHKFLIDGFPRALDQAEAFETQICAPSAVLFFDCPEEEMESRLLKRGESSGRADDNIETIKKRFTTFVEQSVPVVESYERRSLAYRISAVPPPDEVYVSVKAAMDQVEGNNPKREVVFVLGGPGSGKGTQCEQIVVDFGFKHLSAGDLLRQEVASGSETGKMCADLMKEGKLVPMEVTIGLLKAEMDRSDNHLFLIDGFPRATDQAKAFEDQLGPPSAVLFFDCPEEEMERRLLKRGETSGREDDNIETIKKRFSTFVEQSMPVMEEYEARGLAYRISAVPPPTEVYKSTRDALLKVTGPLGDASIVFLFGGPGAGKGTQSAKIVKEFKYTHLSTGDLMRAEVAAGTELGRTVATLIQEGKLVPDEITVELIRKEIVESGAKHFVLDGFPRTLAQARKFEKLIKKPTAAILLECPWDELENRVVKRGETSGRNDDTLETVRKRFDVFREHTLPVVDHYYDLGVGYKISSAESVQEVYGEVKKIFSALRRPLPRSVSMQELAKHDAHSPHAAGALKKLIDPWSELDVIFLLGGPGSGKGTQAAKIKEKYGYEVMHAGDLLRDEVARGSTMGRQCAGLMSSGKLVPMETTLVILKKAMLERAQEEGAKRFLVTGFPRSIQQAEVFELELKKPMAVICLDVSEKVMQTRLMKSNTFKGAAHMARQTHAETFQQRFQTYKDNTIPVIELFEHQGLATRISAEGSADDVFAEVCKLLDNVHHQESLPSHRTPLLCISGPSGAGKHTLIGKLKKEFKKMVGFSVSHTTKEMRLCDVDGDLYYFTDKKTMEAEIAEGKFLEHAEVRGEMYGTSFGAVQEVLDDGKVCILDINVQGVQEVQNNPSAVKAMFVFIRPPSIEVLEERLKQRGADSEDSVAKKVASAQLEISTATSSDLFDLVITNADADKAYEELRDFLHSKMPATFTNPELTAKRNARIAEEEMLKAIPASLDPDLPVREYMKKHVISVLKRGMNSLNETRPADPLQYLADYLVSHKPASYT